jgi:hypothetical protein
VAAVLVGLSTGGLVVADHADAASVRLADASDYSVTFVARVCDDYPDVMANRARNDIQESLRDLGIDTRYPAGSPVRPIIENSVATQRDNCRPLNDWRLALGTGYTGKTASSLYLSTVTGAYPTSIVTQPSVPQLDDQGNPTGQTIEGAVTVTLTQAQAERAQRANSLWTQGGTPIAPLNGLQQEYGFAALRCGIDNLNGDNVEWIAFNARATHTFCYYYAIQPPPQSAVITVRKQLAAGTSGPASFRFEGNITYNENESFTLTPQSSTQPASAQYVRAAGTAWDFEEQPSPGFVPTGPPTCSDTGGAGGSSITITGQRVVVNPTPGAQIVCTYTNQADVTGPLRLSKVSVGNVGTFDFDVTFPTNVTNEYDVTTVTPGVPETVVEVPAGPTGPYSVTETLPADGPTGSWEMTGATCDGNDLPLNGTTFGGTVALGQSVDCVVENTFTPGGSLTIRKTTIGGIGNFGYVVQQIDESTESLTGESAAAVAEVTQEETATTAVVSAAQSSLDLDALPVGEDVSRFAVSELLPPRDATGRWRSESVTCTGGALIDRNGPGGYIEVRITEEDPNVVCDFVNEFVPSALVTVSKQVEGDSAGRADDVVIQLVCEDGTDQELRVPTSADGGTLPTRVFYEPTTCLVDEVSSGLADNAQVETSIDILFDGELVDTVSDSAVEFDVEPGDDLEFVVINTYTVDDSGGGDGGGAGGGDGDGSGAGGDTAGGALPDTGPGDALVAAQWALLLILIGGFIAAMAAQSRRFAWR